MKRLTAHRRQRKRAESIGLVVQVLSAIMIFIVSIITIIVSSIIKFIKTIIKSINTRDGQHQ